MFLLHSLHIFLIQKKQPFLCQEYDQRPSLFSPEFLLKEVPVYNSFDQEQGITENTSILPKYTIVVCNLLKLSLLIATCVIYSGCLQQRFLQNKGPGKSIPLDTIFTT